MQKSSPLELPKSGLSLENGTLVKRTAKGSVTGTIALDDVHSIRAVRNTDFYSIVVSLGVAGLGVVAKTFIPSAGWSWAVAVFLLTIAATFFVTARRLDLRIESASGLVHYPLMDMPEDTEGFVYSLKRMVSEPKRGSGSAAKQTR